MNNIHRNPFVETFIAVLLWCLVAPLQAAEQAGKILYARGTVSIVDDQDSARGGRTGAPLYVGERVVTGRGAVAQLRLTDGALIALRGSSDYQIEKQTYGEDEGLYEQAGKLFTGWMRSITGAIGQKYPQKVSQSTTVATIGIRGTTYQVLHIPPEGLPGFAGEQPGTYVFLEEGEVEMTGEQGSRLLKPGDVVFIPIGGGAPQLVPEKASLFSQPESDAISFIESESTDFSDALNETLTDTLDLKAEGPFVNLALVGAADFLYNGEAIFSAWASDPVFSGTGASRVLTGLTITNEVPNFYAANSGASAQHTGYHLYNNGSAVNWGMWGVGDYTISDDLGNPITPFDNWHYVVASNIVPESALAGLTTGQVTFNYIGGTPLVYNDATNGPVVQQITGGTMTFDFSLGSIALNLSSGLGTITSGCSSTCFTDLYNNGMPISASLGYSGSMTGAVVADGAGVATALALSGGANEFYRGTAVFETSTPISVPDSPVSVP